MSGKKLKIIFQVFGTALIFAWTQENFITRYRPWNTRLDFTAPGAANDFFHTFSNFISGKNILSNVFSYVTVGALILLLIIILPCIVRILRQMTIVYFSFLLLYCSYLFVLYIFQLFVNISASSQFPFFFTGLGSSLLLLL